MGMTKVKKRLFWIVLSISFIVCFCYLQNNWISIRTIDYRNEAVPEEFTGFKIAQISDLHGKKFGRGQKILLNKVRKIAPDIIVITGDLTDTKADHLDNAMNLIHGAIEIAPVYYVNGNHEITSGDYNEIRVKLEEAGVRVLTDEHQILKKADAFISIYGLSEPDKSEEELKAMNRHERIKEALRAMTEHKEGGFQILLSHRPELFNAYVESGFPLVLTGHAHGGQFRLPFVGGIVAPNQGFFPRYTSGPYIEKNTAMIVSRGLGNSVIPLRIFNYPEIVVITLKGNDRVTSEWKDNHLS